MKLSPVTSAAAPTARNASQACQERNSIEAIKDDSWTEKLRRWFTKAAPLPEKPRLIHPPPWEVQRVKDKWHLYHKNTSNLVAEFDDCATAEYARDAANAYYELSMVSALTYNRIRAGTPFWNGGKEDCELWSRVRKLLK
jgi:hypothetical protein